MQGRGRISWPFIFFQCFHCSHASVVTTNPLINAVPCGTSKCSGTALNLSSRFTVQSGSIEAKAFCIRQVRNSTSRPGLCLRVEPEGGECVENWAGPTSLPIPKEYMTVVADMSPCDTYMYVLAAHPTPHPIPCTMQYKTVMADITECALHTRMVRMVLSDTPPHPIPFPSPCNAWP